MAEALLITISIPPNLSTVCLIALAICASSLISTCTAKAFTPNASTSAAAENMVPPKRGSSSTDFAAITILAPAPANFKAMAFPMPLLPPVINTVFPCKDIVVNFNFNNYFIKSGPKNSMSKLAVSSQAVSNISFFTIALN